MLREIKEQIDIYLTQHEHFVDHYNRTGSAISLQWVNFYAEQIFKLRKFLDNQLIIKIGTENDPEILKITLKTKELEKQNQAAINLANSLKKLLETEKELEQYKKDSISESRSVLPESNNPYR